MKQSFLLSDENGKNPVEIEFYIDDPSLVIESAEIKIWADVLSVSSSDLNFWISACGGEDAVLRNAIASTIPGHSDGHICSQTAMVMRREKKAGA